VGFLADEGVEIAWADWLPLGLTLCAIMLPLSWLLLTRVALPVRVGAIPGARGMLRDELRALGAVGRGEWIVIVVFGLVAMGWIFRSPVTDWFLASGSVTLAERIDALGDPGIVMLGAIALFAIPVHPSRGEFAMDWRTANKMPWDVLLLFGGGLSLAAAMKASGLDVFLGTQMSGLDGLPPWLLIVLVCSAVIMLTELTSNTATTAAFVPILGAAAPGLGLHPAALMVPAGIVASYAFMLPVATPPNAIAFSSGRVTIRQMARAGLLLNLLGVVVVSVVMSTVGLRLLGIETQPQSRTAPDEILRRIEAPPPG
jgi:sodium-dependent dicarboxylate transporter 2/3/5